MHRNLNNGYEKLTVHYMAVGLVGGQIIPDRSPKTVTSREILSKTSERIQGHPKLCCIAKII